MAFSYRKPLRSKTKHAMKSQVLLSPFIMTEALEDEIVSIRQFFPLKMGNGERDGSKQAVTSERNRTKIVWLRFYFLLTFLLSFNPCLYIPVSGDNFLCIWESYIQPMKVYAKTRLIIFSYSILGTVIVTNNVTFQLYFWKEFEILKLNLQWRIA